MKDNQPKLCDEVQQHFQAYWEATPTDELGPFFDNQFDKRMDERSVGAVGPWPLTTVCHFVRNGMQKLSSRCKLNEL